MEGNQKQAVSPATFSARESLLLPSNALIPDAHSEDLTSTNLQQLCSPRGTSSSWPGSILNEAFHFLAAPAPQCASNWVHENSRSASGLRRQSAHSQITRWGPSSKVPRMLLQVTTNCRAQGVSGMGHAPAGHQELQGTVLPGAGMLSKQHTNHRLIRGIAQSAQPSLASRMPCQTKPPMGMQALHCSIWHACHAARLVEAVPHK